MAIMRMNQERMQLFCFVRINPFTGSVFKLVYQIQRSATAA